MKEKKFEITEELAQKILNYLTEKPFKEVAALVSELMRLRPIEQNKDTQLGKVE